jgi:hypothetical protein
MGLYVKITLLAALLFLPACSQNTGDKVADQKASPRPLKEDILGDWRAALNDGSTLELSFAEKLVDVTYHGKTGSVALGSMGYEVDSAKNIVKIDVGGAEPATVKPRKRDGALLLTGDFKMGTDVLTVADIYVERMKPGEKKRTVPKDTLTKPSKTNSQGKPSESKSRPPVQGDKNKQKG